MSTSERSMPCWRGDLYDGLRFCYEPDVKWFQGGHPLPWLEGALCAIEGAQAYPSGRRGRASRIEAYLAERTPIRWHT